MTWVEIAESIRAEHSVSARAALRLAHGWTQQQASEQWNLQFPDEPKDKKNFSYWERWPVAGRAPSLDDLLKLAELYQCGVPDLLSDLRSFRDHDPALADRPTGQPAANDFLRPTGDDTLRSPAYPVVSPSIEPALAESLVATLEHHYVTENLVGPGPLLDVVSREFRFVEQQLLAAPTHSGHPTLLNVAARFAEFLGWLHQDSGDLRSALHWSTSGLEFAQAAEDSLLTSYIWMRKSNISSDARRADLSLAFAETALANADGLPPQLWAVALRQAAHAHALRGESAACQRCLDEAMSWAMASDEEEGLGSYCTPNYVEMEAANCWIELDRTQAAVDALERGLRGWNGAYRRDLGLCLARLAVAYAANEQPGQAVATAGDALSFGLEVGSHRILDQIERVPILLADVGAIDDAGALQAVLARRRIASQTTSTWRTPAANAHHRQLG